MAENGGTLNEYMVKYWEAAMKIYDISMTIEENMTVYKNKEEKKPKIVVRNDFSSGKVYETSITLDAHTGTHIDAPLHMVEGGETIDNIDLRSLVGECIVLDLTKVENTITEDDLKNFDFPEGSFILLKTRNSFTDTFDSNFVYLDKSGAQYLEKMKIKGVGTDGLGIERAQANYCTHTTLLGQGIIIIEGLRLKAISPGKYRMAALPLKIKGTEAAPARVILYEE